MRTFGNFIISGTGKRKAAALALFILLCLGAVLTGKGPGPYHALTGLKIPGLAFETPFTSLLTMPLDFAGNALAGAPVPLWAFASTALWAALAGGFFSYRARRRKGEEEGRALAFSGLTALLTLAVAVSYAFMLLVVRFPGTRLVNPGGNFITADLQSHTTHSHDAFVTPRENLLWHRDRGFDVVAVTDHNNVGGSVATLRVAETDPSLPGVITGIEVRLKDGMGYICAVGVDPAAIPPGDVWPREAPAFFDAARKAGAALITLQYKLPAETVEKLVSLGVDGFDVASLGHPDMNRKVRALVEKTIAEKGLAPVAWTDWHGWGGFSRVWTAVKVPGAAGLSREEKARKVVEALKNTKTAEVVPVVSGGIREPGPLRVLFSPAVEFFRYLGELSGEQLTALAAWILAFSALCVGLGMKGLDPLKTIAGAYCSVISLLLLKAGLELIHLRLFGGAPYPFPWKIGLEALFFAAAAGFAAFLILRKTLKRKRVF